MSSAEAENVGSHVPFTLIDIGPPIPNAMLKITTTNGTFTMRQFEIGDAIYRAIWCLRAAIRYLRCRRDLQFAIWVFTMKATLQIAGDSSQIANVSTIP